MKLSLSLPVALLTAALLSAAQSTHAQSSTEFSWSRLPTAQQPSFKADTFNITRYGAKPDGLTLNTQSINAAIADCSSKGGGVVLVPQGLWLTGPVELKSNVNLHLVRAAVLQFSADFNQYPLVLGSYEGQPAYRNQSPLSGTGLENVAITGHGIVDGNGDAWRMVGRDKLTEREWKSKVASGGSVSEDGKVWYPSEKSRLGAKTPNASAPGRTKAEYEAVKDYLRPNMVVLTSCKKVLLQDVTFQNSPAWCLHPIMCQDLTVRNALVRNPDYAQNGDGLDIESCRNVLVEGSTFDVGDDGICIKSGKDEEGRKRGIPTENALIRNNVVYRAHGGFVIGSEMSGGARNLFVEDCTFMGTDIGLRFKTARGRGGVVENIHVRNIAMKDIVHDAILFDMYYFMKPPAKLADGQAATEPVPAVSEATPRFQNFTIRNIVCDGAERGIFLRGLPEMSVRQISLDNLVLKVNKGVELIEAQDIRISNLRLETKAAAPVVYVENSRNISFDGMQVNAPTNQALFSVSGNRTEKITAARTEAGKGRTPIEAKAGASIKALKVKS
ncbi:glycoside hydrolase family 28 protein [Hymenobacter crusticola]|uniref:Glycoside hydrolase n=1 Tax=Hymenobacter crusticola TaxID=1770526 RepID=A0A243W6I2_9BACT|nr:glycoside hydrolase family 28 protein [Hymenobacter crusticola]OUJ70008.1 glycoside hydrolase [Hymenobacter crusticola]